MKHAIGRVALEAEVAVPEADHEHFGLNTESSRFTVRREDESSGTARSM